MAERTDSDCDPATTEDPTFMTLQRIGFGPLATDGGPPSDWAQLIRALGVLGQAERAAEIGAEAEEAFAANPDALRLIRLAVRDAAQAATRVAE